MSYMKRYFIEHIEEFSEEDLRNMGYDDQDIEIFRECFPHLEEGA